MSSGRDTEGSTATDEESTEQAPEGQASEAQASENGGDAKVKAPNHEESLIPDEERSDDGQVYVDREAIDFEPEEGLYSGTAVDGTTDIPGPHENADDTTEDTTDSVE